MQVQEKDKEPIKQELSDILAKYYDGSFARLVREYIHISGMTEEEREALVEIMKQTKKKKKKPQVSVFNGFNQPEDITSANVRFQNNPKQ